MADIDDVIADLETKVAALTVPSLTTEQFVRLSLAVACVRRGGDSPTDTFLKDFVESMSGYVLTGNKERG